MSPRSTTNVALLVVCFLVGVFVGQHILNNNQPAYHARSRHDSWKSIFDNPLNPDKTDCRALFDKPDSDDEFYSATYLEQRRQFEANLKRIVDSEKEKRSKFAVVEGHSGGAKHQSRMYHWLAGRPWVNTICEIGFNAGHSTLQWLTGDDHANVYSFDIGSHYYTRPMADYLNRTFHGRLHLIIGDSLKTVPQFVAGHRDVKCDVIVIDCGHTHDVAFGDLRSMRELANVEQNVLVLDDKNMEPLMSAWNLLRAERLVVDRFACTDRKKYGRAYVVGYYA